jgi:hypothetical protein
MFLVLFLKRTILAIKNLTGGTPPDPQGRLRRNMGQVLFQRFEAPQG